MVAKTGFWIETRVIHMSRPLLLHRRRRRAAACDRGLDSHDLGLVALAQVVETRGQHLGLGLEAMQHLDAPFTRVAAAGGHDAAHQGPVLDHPDLFLAGIAGDGGQRHGQALGVVGQHHLGDGVLAGAVELPGVVQHQRHANRACARFGARRDARNACLHRLVHALDLHLHRHARLQPADLMGAHQARQLQPGEIDDGQDLLLGGQLLARQRMALGDDAIDRRHQRGLAQCHLAGVELGPGRKPVRTGRFECGARGVQRGLRNEVLGRQTFVGLVAAFGLVHLGAHRLDAGAALGDPVAQFLQVDLAKRLAGLDTATLADREAQQRAVGLGLHDHRARCHQRATEFDRRRHRGQRRLDDLARHELQRRLLRVVTRLLGSIALARHDGHAGPTHDQHQRGNTAQLPRLAHGSPKTLSASDLCSLETRSLGCSAVVTKRGLLGLSCTAPGPAGSANGRLRRPARRWPAALSSAGLQRGPGRPDQRADARC
mmetsp:Transcript_102143/g.284544  ORF Transcript_102143/g.284544 Transcript_102143/m.284544 type:complete len:488 (+) Transcript_102143:839-2302(+)